MKYLIGCFYDVYENNILRAYIAEIKNIEKENNLVIVGIKKTIIDINDALIDLDSIQLHKDDEDFCQTLNEAIKKVLVKIFELRP